MITKYLLKNILTIDKNILFSSFRGPSPFVTARVCPQKFNYFLESGYRITKRRKREINKLIRK